MVNFGSSSLINLQKDLDCTTISGCISNIIQFTSKLWSSFWRDSLWSVTSVVCWQIGT